MSEIYISSTYIDLREQRLRVNDVARALGHTVRAMEMYVAEDSRSLDVCRRDVRECALYVGIFAWRYGWIPPGEQKSITEFEYQEARAHNKPCLIFLLDEDAPWPGSMTDDDRSRVRDLRRRLSENHTPALFRDGQDLSKKVGDAIKKWKPEARPVPEFLLHLADRERQERALGRALRDWPWRHPPVYMIPGDEQQCHEKFRERIVKRIVRRALQLNEETGSANYHLSWPTRERKVDEVRGALEDKLAEAVLESYGSIADAQERLKTLSVPVGVHAHVTTAEWQSQGPAIFEGFCRMWDEWPPLAPRQRLFATLTVEYRLADSTEARPGWRRFLKPFGGQARQDFTLANQQLAGALAALDPKRFPRCLPMVLAPLSCVEEGETEQWARSDEIRKVFLDTESLVEDVRQLYRKRDRTCIPMAHLAPELRRLLAAGTSA